MEELVLEMLRNINSDRIEYNSIERLYSERTRKMRCPRISITDRCLFCPAPSSLGSSDLLHDPHLQVIDCKLVKSN